MRNILLFLILVFLIGCRSAESKRANEVVWHQAGKTQQEISKDFFDCKIEAGQLQNPVAAAGYWGAVANCMEAKGYTRCPRSEVPAGEATIR